MSDEEMTKEIKYFKLETGITKGQLAQLCIDGHLELETEHWHLKLKVHDYYHGRS